MSEGIYTAVLVDTRINDLFELVLDNFYNRLDKRWNFMIFCSTNNKDFLYNLINTTFSKDKYRTTLVVLNIGNNPIGNNIFYNEIRTFIDYDYSKLMTDATFYNLIPTEMMLIFQLDTLLSDKYHNNIYNFMDYDYVGSPWKDKNFGGNGGLSLRRKSKMLEIINDKNYDKNKPDFYYFEDGYFCNYPNINMPEREISKTFSVESYHYDKSAGIHKSFCFSTPEQYKELISHIPRLYELQVKWCQLNTTSQNYRPNLDGSYKTDFFRKYEVIQFF